MTPSLPYLGYIIFEQSPTVLRNGYGWIGGWMDEGKSHFNDCLQLSTMTMTKGSQLRGTLFRPPSRGRSFRLPFKGTLFRSAFNLKGVYLFRRIKTRRRKLSGSESS